MPGELRSTREICSARICPATASSVDGPPKARWVRTQQLGSMPWPAFTWCAHTNRFGRRRRILAEDAYVVRQRAIRRGNDLEGWHLSRLMRDAATPFEVTTAERRYLRWLRASPLRRGQNGCQTAIDGQNLPRDMLAGITCKQKCGAF